MAPIINNQNRYHKINSIFKRSHETHKLIVGDYSCPEYSYLENNPWDWTEKVDGTNIRVIAHGKTLEFGGRTENAQIPAFLVSKLRSLFDPLLVAETSVFEHTECEVVLFGEGFGAKIQKGGGNYIQDGVDFALFDVTVDGVFLAHENVMDIAASMNLEIAPLVGKGTLREAVTFASSGFSSAWGDFPAEGIVARPSVEMLNRRGHRIITKIKTKDFQ